MRAMLPSLPNLAARLLIATVAVLGLAHALQRSIVTPLLPVFGAVLGSLDSDVRVLNVATGHDGPNDTVRFDVNLAHPVEIGGKTVYPYGTHSIPDGFMTVNLGAAGLLQYALLLMILVLAWPFDSAAEGVARLLVAAPCVVLLIVIPGPSTALSLVWGPFHEALAPGAFWPSLAWSRFLSGGGGLAVAATLAAVAIAIGRRNPGSAAGTTGPAPPPQPAPRQSADATPLL